MITTATAKPTLKQLKEKLCAEMEREPSEYLNVTMNDLKRHSPGCYLPWKDESYEEYRKAIFHDCVAYRRSIKGKK